MRNLLAEGAEVDRRDFLARAELLAACGMTDDHLGLRRLLPAGRLHRCAYERDGSASSWAYRACSTSSRRRTTPSCREGSSRVFGRLFKNDLKLYIYPLRRSEEEDLQTVDHLEVEEELRPLYAYLAGRGQLCRSGQFPARLPLHLQSRCAQTDRRR